jgi:hypothetical protein
MQGIGKVQRGIGQSQKLPQQRKDLQSFRQGTDENSTQRKKNGVFSTDMKNRLCILLLLGVLAAVAGCGHLVEPRSRHEWRTLLSGTMTNGWQMVGPGGFHIEENELVTEGGMGLLWYTREKFRNCEIRVVFRLTGKNDNSGVFIRIPDRPLDPWQAVNTGYEVQIANEGDTWHRTGALYSLTEAKAIVSPKLNEWATLLITLDGLRTQARVNGQLVTDYREGEPVPEKKIWYEPNRGPRPKAGYIGLQNHGGDARVHFKEVSVRSLH